MNNSLAATAPIYRVLELSKYRRQKKEKENDTVTQ